MAARTGDVFYSECFPVRLSLLFRRPKGDRRELDDAGHCFGRIDTGLHLPRSTHSALPHPVQELRFGHRAADYGVRHI
jgi:hypothetical protein